MKECDSALCVCEQVWCPSAAVNVCASVATSLALARRRLSAPCDRTFEGRGEPRSARNIQIRHGWVGDAILYVCVCVKPCWVCGLLAVRSSLFVKDLRLGHIASDVD